MRIALDTNILAYAEGVGDEGRRHAAIKLIDRLPPENVVLPAQILGELFRVLTGKAEKDAKFSHKAVLAWSDAFEVADSAVRGTVYLINVSPSEKAEKGDGFILIPWWK